MIGFTEKLNGDAVRKCLCPSSSPSETVIDGEICCSKCGVVVGRDTEQEAETISKLSLYVRHTLGSPAKNRPKESQHLHIYQTDLELTSNACNKLNLPDWAQEDVRKAYKHLRAHGMQKSHAAAYAIYRVTKLNDIPLSEDEIIDAIRIAFHVQRVPRYFAVSSEVSKIPDLNTASYLLEKEERTKSKRYYLLLYIKKACQKYPRVSSDALKAIAVPAYEASKIPNLDTRAKHAVGQALIRIGVR